MVAGLVCRHLCCEHLHHVWDIGTLAALWPILFWHLKTIVVDSVGGKLPKEEYVSILCPQQKVPRSPCKRWLDLRES
jgi:hypothetical protein